MGTAPLLASPSPMDLVIPYWHPLAVHVPIALYPFGAVAALAYALTGRAFWRGVALLAFAAGALGAWAAVATGETLHAEVEGTPVVDALVEQHERYGEGALWLGAAAALVLLGATLWASRKGADVRARDPLPFRLGALALALAAAVLVVLAGRLGGLMVWGVAA